ncbi:MAG: tetratricopeptide repeat protein [Candidatus Magasanikbacteria bacterium]
MYIYFLVAIIVCLAVIVFIIVRKFPQLTNLDLTNLAEEQQSKKKQQIIGQRIEEHSKQVKENWKKRLQPVVRFWRVLQFNFRVYVGKVERLWYHDQVAQTDSKLHAVPPKEDIKKFNTCMTEADQFLVSGKLNQAEELFIKAIKIDQKSPPAYRGLGDTYLAKNSLEEARETYKFLLQLDPEDDVTMVKLAQIAESQGDIEEAIQYYQQATVINDSLAPRFYHLAELLLKVGQPLVARDSILQAVQLETKNPKYLDLLVETAIICGDKSLAQVYFNELRLVNPDNRKLSEFLQRIDRL